MHVHSADGSLGLAAYAPYHGIVVAAAAPQVPEPLTQQLAGGGADNLVPVGAGRAPGVDVADKTRRKLLLRTKRPLPVCAPRGSLRLEKGNSRKWS